MVKISAFKALRPTKKLVQKVPTKTYLNYSEEEIVKEKKNNPYSFLHIIHQKQIKKLDERFKKIKLEIDDFKSKKILIKDKKDCLYVYEQSKGMQKYVGLICAISIKDYNKNKIKIHEKTIEKREVLFTQYLCNTKIHAEPVLITYNSNIKHIQRNHRAETYKIYDYKTEDDIQHKVWKIENQEEIRNIISKFQNIENLYIADGHHRMASSSRLHNNDKCLAYILPNNMLDNYPYHRVLKVNQETKEMLKKISTKKPTQEPEKNTQKLQFYLDKTWYEISVTNEKAIIDNLSVNKLLKNILTPIFSIKNERDSKSIKFIPGNKKIKDILDMISNSEVLFWMNQISIDIIIEIANKHQTTPPKSTFILPKIPSGLIMMELS